MFSTLLYDYNFITSDFPYICLDISKPSAPDLLYGRNCYRKCYIFENIVAKGEIAHQLYLTIKLSFMEIVTKGIILEHYLTDCQTIMEKNKFVYWLPWKPDFYMDSNKFE